jgi:HlyD family secretion protein
VGQRNGLSAQIMSGVNENDCVIVHPDDQVHDGVRAAPRCYTVFQGLL